MKTKYLIPILAMMAFFGVAITPAPANAYTLADAPDCAVFDVFDPEWDKCVGAYETESGEPTSPVQDGGPGDIATMILNDDDAFGVGGGWMFLEKDDDSAATDCVSTTGIGSTSGTVTICDFGESWPIEVALVLKGSNTFSLYYWAALAGPPGEIDWGTDGTATNRQGTAQALSGISVYYRKGGMDVPEPTTLALLGAGLIAFGAARRRRI